MGRRRRENIAYAPVDCVYKLFSGIWTDTFFSGVQNPKHLRDVRRSVIKCDWTSFFMKFLTGNHFYSIYISLPLSGSLNVHISKG